MTRTNLSRTDAATIKIAEITPRDAVFSVKGRKDTVRLFLRTPTQLAIDVPYKDTRFFIRAKRWGTANKDAEAYKRCRAENDLDGLRELAAAMLKRADEFRGYKKKRFFEVGGRGFTVYVACTSAEPVRVKAAAIERLAELGRTNLKPKDLTIFTSEGMRPGAFAKRWVLNFDDLDETIADMRRDLVQYPDLANPVTPAGLRADIEEFPTPFWEQVRSEWSHSMRMLGADTADRATFDRTFDRLVSQRMAAAGK